MHTDIKDFVEQINEARNVLIYTFNFPYSKEVIEQLSQSSDEEKFKRLCKHIHTACRPLFCSSINEKNPFNPDDGLAGGQWQFFGDKNLNTSQEAYPVGPLRCLDTYCCYNIWEEILTHHCLLTTFDRLHAVIFKNIQFTGYDIARHLGCTGMNYALNHDHLHLEVSGERYLISELTQKSRNAIIDSNTASNYGRNSYPQCFSTISSYFSKYNKYENLYKQIVLKYTADNKPFNVTVPGTLLPLLLQLRGRGKNLANIFNLYDGQRVLKQSDIDKFLKSVSEIQDEPIKPLHGESRSLQLTYTDKIYNEYKLEQTFNFNFVYCITKNIQILDQRLNQRFCEDTAFIDSIVAFISLPNTFSRHLLIQMAFDCYSDCLCFNNSLLTQRLRNPDSVVVIDKRAIKTTDPYVIHSRWMEACLNFINYMTEIVFPIYESYFFVAIYDLFFDSNVSIEQNILNIYRKLGNYIEKANIYAAVHGYENMLLKNSNFKSVNGEKPLSNASFIVPNYKDTRINTNTFSKVALSSYNHIPLSKSSLINRDFLYKHFQHSKDGFLNACIADMVRN